MTDCRDSNKFAFSVTGTIPTEPYIPGCGESNEAPFDIHGCPEIGHVIEWEGVAV